MVHINSPHKLLGLPNLIHGTDEGINTAAVGCGDGVAAERLCRAAALASLKQPMHAAVVLGEMAVNACCKPVPRLAIGSSPTAPQTHF